MARLVCQREGNEHDPMLIASPNLGEAYSDVLRKLKTKVEKNLETTPCISILVTGKTGSGKSTLVNGILGLRANESANERTSIKTSCTREVKGYTREKSGITVTVWDSPGLEGDDLDDRKYLQQIQEQCSKVDLVMCCVKVVEARFVHGPENPDVVAMKRFTAIFGRDFWRRTVIVLTFANVLESLHFEWRDLSQREKVREFREVIQMWEEQIKSILIKDVKVPKDIVNTVKTIPAGHYMAAQLPGIEDWLFHLWFHCVDTIDSQDIKRALLPELPVFRHREEITKKETTNSLTGVLTGTVAGTSSGATAGAVVGTAVLGPVGTVLGVGIGGLVGGLIGVGTAAYKLLNQETDSHQ